MLNKCFWTVIFSAAYELHIQHLGKSAVGYTMETVCYNSCAVYCCLPVRSNDFLNILYCFLCRNQNGDDQFVLRYQLLNDIAHLVQLLSYKWEINILQQDSAAIPWFIRKQFIINFRSVISLCDLHSDFSPYFEKAECFL